MKLHFTEIEAPFEKAKVCILPIPYESTVSYMPGTRFGPQSLLEASNQLELWDCEMSWSPSEELGIHTLETIEPGAQGPEAAVETIDQHLAPLLDKGRVIFSLGGEHGISYPLIRAHARQYPEMAVVQIDAHADLRSSFQDTPYSHACVMRRVIEEGIPVYQIGLRSVSQEECEFQQECDLVHSLYAHQMAEMGKPEILAFLDKIPSTIYITLDVDGLDPSVIPGTGTPQPGGLEWNQTMWILKNLLKERQLAGADLVELRPLGGEPRSQFTAAKLVYKLLSYAFHPSQQKSS